MTCTLIITTYNWKEALELVLNSSIEQSVLADEIIIADDGSRSDTKEFIDNFRKKSPIPITHVWQEDNGFRVASIRNKAIAKSIGEYIVLIDGDIILHKDFIKEHKKSALKNYFIQGGRVLTTQAKAKKVLKNKQIKFSFFEDGLRNRKNSIHSNFLSKLFLKKQDTLKGIKTCNFSFFKEDCIKINGFNEDFIGWGREDSEFASRLINSGIHRQNIRFNCLAYHVWHNENTRNNLLKNDKILKETIENNLKSCQNGIDKYL